MVKVLVTNSKPVKFKLDGLVPSEGKCSLKVQRSVGNKYKTTIKIV